MLGSTCIVVLMAAVLVSQATAVDENDWMEVEIAQGRVRGHRDENGEIFGFYNIPYASVPEGEDKFKEALPPPVWLDETYDAVEKELICPQAVFPLHSEEQCLVANVYVPDTPKKNLNVIVYVHGGGFNSAYGNFIKHKKLMKDKDIIVVNFNYRLAVHGFLCLGTEGIPGNAGLKDQITLLRWVQENIAAFGGNPKEVTIAGYSAGSMSVDLLMLSKAAVGLFNKVIPESGANLGAGVVQMDPVQKARDCAITLNFTNVDDIDALEKFYTTLPYEILSKISTCSFPPCVEREHVGAVLTESPLSILKKGDYRKVPMLYGFANMEGVGSVGMFESLKAKMNERFSKFLPIDLKFESDAEKEKVAEQIKNLYFGNKPVDNNSILDFVNYQTDKSFGISTLRAVKLHVQAGNDQIYLYQYSFFDEDTPVVPHTNVRGAEHCAQTIAVSDAKSFLVYDENGISEKYMAMKNKMREIWHNFITTGKPVPEGSSFPAWPAANADRSPYMELAENIELGGSLLEDRMRVWDEIYENYSTEPQPPTLQK